jgi:hypothetical protein
MDYELFEDTRGAASYIAGESLCWQTHKRIMSIIANFSHVTVFRRTRRHETFQSNSHKRNRVSSVLPLQSTASSFHHPVNPRRGRLLTKRECQQLNL